MMSARSFALEIAMPDFMAAVDFQTRVAATAPAQVVPTAEGSAVVLAVPQSGLRNVLSSLGQWLEDHGLRELDVRINQRPFTLQRQTSGGLRWRDAAGTELDDVDTVF